MKPTALAIAALCLAACNGPAQEPAPPPEPSAAEAFPDRWFELRAVDWPTPDGFAALLNIHTTASGVSGYLGKAGVYSPVRNIELSDTLLTFAFPETGASFAAERIDTGPWRGSFAISDAMTLEVVEIDTPPESVDLVILPDGRRMHMVCEGQGVPVVLLDYGAGGTMKKDWGDLAPQMATRAGTRVCAYDRAGRGLSDPAATPRDAAAVAADIDAMLTAADVPPPYVLVGHSLGSYHVRQYANTHADKTAGLVLIDPSGDGQLERFDAAIPKVREMQDAMRKAQADLNCIHKLTTTPVPPDDPLAQQCGGNDPVALAATRSEIDEMPGASTQQLKLSRRPYGAMPLIVLTRADYEKDMPLTFTPEDKQAMRRVWETMHAEMAALSNKSQHRFVDGASHYIQRDAPDAVIQAVADVVAAARDAAR